MVDVVSRLR